MTAPVTDIFEEAISSDKLLERACLDAVQALIKFAVVGHSVDDAIVRLEKLRQRIEEEP
jgi:hypothetical protein